MQFIFDQMMNVYLKITTITKIMARRMLLNLGSKCTKEPAHITQQCHEYKRYKNTSNSMKMPII